MRHKFSCKTLVLAGLLSLTSCGGGGDSPSVLFNLINTTPADGTTDVTRSVQPQATFSQKLNTSSVTVDSVQLLSPLGLPIAAGISISDAVLNLKPTAGTLPGDSTYTLKLGTGLQGTVGGALTSAANISFTTAAQQWGPIKQVSTPLSLASSPSVAAGAANTASAIWLENNGVDDMVFSSYFSNGSWSTPAQISSNTGNVLGASVAANNTGNAVAVWSQLDGGRYQLYASRYSHDSDSWSTPVKVDNRALTQPAMSPKVITNAAGNTTAIWAQPSELAPFDFLVYASRSSDGITWGTPVLVQAIGNDERLAAATNADGKMIVVWVQDNGTRYVLYASRSNDGTVWSAPVQVDNPSSTNNVRRPAVAMDAANNPTVIWPQPNGTRAILNASHYINGNWSAPIQIDSPAATSDAENPVATVDIAGNVYAVWTQTIGGLVHNYSSRYSNGSWSAPFQVDSASAPDEAMLPTVATDATGNVIVLWRQDTHPGNLIKARWLE